jgi:hypothetical protein
MSSEKRTDPGAAGASLRDRLDALTGRGIESAESLAEEARSRAARAAAEAALSGAWSAFKKVVSSEADSLLRSSEEALAEAERARVGDHQKLEAAATQARTERLSRKSRAEEELARLKAGGGGPKVASPTNQTAEPSPSATPTGRPKKTL